MPAVPIVDRLADAEAVRARLQRMFPRFDVHAEPFDYSHSAAFCFARVVGTEQQRFGVNTPLAFSDPQGDARRIGGKFLRAAFPIGWAKP